MMNFKEQQKKFIRELELFLELWKKTKAKDPQDFKRFMEDFQRRIKNQQFITIRDTGDREAFLTISDQIKNDFSQLGEKYGKKIYDILKQGVKEDTSRTLMYDRAMREVRKGKQYAYTWVNTAENAINQAQRLRENIEAGVKYFKYAGPPADREFCQHLLDKVYTVEEIEQMDNGQGLPVLYYKGGYNCRHRWAPVNNLAGKQRGDVIPIAHKNKIVELKPVNITEKVKKDIESDLQNLNKITNKKDLITWCKDNVANNVTAGFAELDIEDIRQIAKTVYTLNDRFGLPKLNKLAKGKDDDNASYYGAPKVKLDHPQNPDSLRIGKTVVSYLNSDDSKKYQMEIYAAGKRQNITADEQLNAFYLSLNTEDVVVHEFGHRFHYLNAKEMNVLYDEHIKTKEWEEYNVGRASDNYYEYFAEMFSRYYHGKPIPKEVANYFNKKINEVKK